MISVILCGGAGSRLWPLSRDLHPKPFLPLPSGRSLLEESYFRAAALPQTAGIITVTGRDLYFKAAETWQRAALSISHNYILEPVGRNTAPAIIAAALETIRLHGSETPMLILAADHIITDQAALAEAVSRALELAAQDFLVTFGLRPARPDTGFGYIEASGDRALRFVEKPDEETARRYLAAGNFYWNAGLFCFKAGTLLEEMKNLAPELLSATEAAMADAKNGALYLKAGAFSAVPNISIDYALMEKSDKVAVVACDPGWSDVGSWSVLAALHGSDDHGNHCRGPHQTGQTGTP